MPQDKKYVIAVSGGVDSVVLLDMLACGVLPNSNSHPLASGPKANLIVAHFDHGIRYESAGDAKFVGELAQKYGLAYETKREDLGKNASEELARDRRYDFLRTVATKHEATIVTAHHADDIVETIAINLTRGTGWRGLAVLNSPEILRPLLDMTKAEIIDYAKQHDLVWREDITNKDTKYLRNDLRQKLTELDESAGQLLRLYRNRQIALKQQVEVESQRLIGESPYDRHLFITVNEVAALELLRAVFVRETGASPTRPQLARALHAIKVFQAGKVFEVSASQKLRFTKAHFVVEIGVKVLS